MKRKVNVSRSTTHSYAALQALQTDDWDVRSPKMGMGEQICLPTAGSDVSWKKNQPCAISGAWYHHK